LPIADCRLPIGNQPAQARGEMRKFWIHAVFDYRLVVRHSQEAG